MEREADEGGRVELRLVYLFNLEAGPTGSAEFFFFFLPVKWWGNKSGE